MRASSPEGVYAVAGVDDHGREHGQDRQRGRADGDRRSGCPRAHPRRRRRGLVERGWSVGELDECAWRCNSADKTTRNWPLALRHPLRDLVVARQRRVHGVGVQLPEPGGSLEIGELRDARRVNEPERHEDHTEAEPDVLGRQRKPTEHGLRRRARGPAVAEVMLDTPHRVEPQGVRELDLRDRLVVRTLLGATLPVGMRLRPRPWLGLELVEQVELHGPPRQDAGADRRGGYLSISRSRRGAGSVARVQIGDHREAVAGALPDRDRHGSGTDAGSTSRHSLNEIRAPGRLLFMLGPDQHRGNISGSPQAHSVKSGPSRKNSSGPSSL